MARCLKDKELAKEPVPGDAETDWNVWGPQILRGTKSGV